MIDFGYLQDAIPCILKGVPVTLGITGISFVIGIVIGLVVALLRIYKIPVLTQLAGIYISFTRGTPLLVQIFLIYYGIPLLFKQLAIMPYLASISPFYYLCIAFSFNIGAYLAETIRSGILSVPAGQIEAANAMNMPTLSVFLFIILPQALAIAMPSIGNLLLIQLKNTSLAFVIGVPEIIGEAKIIAGRTSRIFEVYLIAAFVYWGICLVLERILLIIERYFTKHFRRTA